ncbi:MAG TPA: T9SS type A sorting domain-containing protein [Chitinophagaceae bacterium]
MKKTLLLPLMWLLVLSVSAQINFSANDFGRVPVYNGNFQYGTNMGYYGNSWDDYTLADIAAGNSSKNIKGVGSKTFHLPLPESFLEFWGYNVRVDMFNHYASLGVKDNTVFLEDPKGDHRDPTNFGCVQSSRLFKNMYEPIWDGGANGTPVNDNNYFALYVYKTVTTYKSYVKFWEIINEPDLEYGTLGDGDPGQPGNWWDNNPPPCNIPNLYAPIFQYIRALRIGYEVIKYVDPSAYVAPGGLGKPAFLDAILRNTDNPANGSVNSSYPLKGGAYFDALSFHMYPIYHLHQWDNSIGGFAFSRHSDAAVKKYIEHKNKFYSTLAARGYNNTTYPAKLVITTENNIPNKAVMGPIGLWIGSQEAQRNYVVKAAVESQKNNISQYYVFVLGDDKDSWDGSASELSFLGLYKNLVGKGPLGNGGAYNQDPNESGVAYKTMSDMLLNKTYDETRTVAMNLPSNVGGGAFKDAAGSYVYVLWAKTTTDQSEAASAVYNFPAGLTSAQLNKREWNFSSTGTGSTVASTNISLTGSPVFLFDSSTPPPPPPPATVNCDNITITPGSGSINLTGLVAPIVAIHVFNSSWATVYNQSYTNSPGNLTIPSLTQGTYYVKVSFYTSTWTPICERFREVIVENTVTPPPGGGTPDCNRISVIPMSGSIKIKGLIAPVVSVQVFNNSWATAYNQFFTNSPDSIIIPSLASGTYHVKVNLLTAAWASICEKVEDANVTGTAAKSQTVTVNEQSNERIDGAVGLNISAMPNPFVNSVYVTIGSDKNENGTISILDAAGRELYKKPVTLQKGINRFTLDGSKYLPGSYYLRLNTSNKVQNVKLIRQ